MDDVTVGAPTWYEDVDGDGYGGTRTTTACDAPDGYVATSTDCDDRDADINPGAVEVCDSIDNDCDGSVDETGAMGGSTWYRDADGDGFGGTTSTTACDAPDGYVATSTDCDDRAATTYPGADELCDDIDNDCDGTVDDSPVDMPSWYPDRDSDGYGDPTASPRVSCDAPTGYVKDATDCDDLDSMANPGQAEICDDVDNDCDGEVDEYGADGAPTWYKDADADGYGDSSRTVKQCDAPDGYVGTGDDCDDSEAAANPGATEICDGLDNDCDGSIDESGATGSTTWYADADGDGYGSLTSSRTACTAPIGYIATSGDCDDTRASVNPGEDELCDGLDNDCNGSIDDAALDESTWYQDADGDGWGTSASTRDGCTAPSGYVSLVGDCNDAVAAANPGETEVCDGIDNDCDGTSDESDAADADTWYRDADSDGFGSSTLSVRACTAPAGYIEDATDCNDADGDINPDASEICDAIDNDCDGTVDVDPVDGALLAADGDGDGFGASGTMGYRCEGVDNELDCVDTDPTEPKVVDDDGVAASADGSSAHPYVNIQDGIDHALACVAVLPGTYTENVDFSGRNVRVLGVEGAASTIIDGNAAGPVVTFNSAETSRAALQGFTLTNGSGFATTSSSSYSCGSGATCTDTFTTTCGGGIYVSGATPTLLDLLIKDNVVVAEADYTSGDDRYYFFSAGGGICFVGTAMNVEQVDLESNSADDGGGAYVDADSNVTFESGWVKDNEAETGAGFHVDGGALALSNSIFSANNASSQGGGVYATNATLTETNVVHAKDVASAGSALYLAATTTATVMNSILWGASAGTGVNVESTATYTGSYSDVYAFLTNYSGVTDPTGSSGNISSYPYFTNATTLDFTLASTSPCKNTGNPATAYNDVDGSRNDMGAFGGAGGAW